MGYGYGPHWGMMGWGDGGFWPFGMIVWLSIIIAFIALISWAFGPRSYRRRYEGETNSTGLDLLEQRYARGEIGRDEYLQKRTIFSAVEVRRRGSNL